MKSNTALYFNLKNRLLFTSLILILSLSFSFLPLSLAKADIGTLPQFFWGQVTTTSGDPAPGVQVNAWINGEPASPTRITDAQGFYAIYPTSSLVVTGNAGDVVEFRVSGEAAGIGRVGILHDDESPEYWEWQEQNPPLTLFEFDEGEWYGADLVYEPPPEDNTPPAQVTDLSVVGQTSTSITLEWTAPGDDGVEGRASYYLLKLRTDGAVTEANWGSSTPISISLYPKPAGETETFTVSGLDHSTTYYFGLKTGDDFDNLSPVSDPSPNGTTEAPDETPPAGVTDLVADNATDSTITLTWTAPGDDGNEGTANAYYIRYNIGSAITDETWNDATPLGGTPSPLPAGSAQSFIVTELTEGTLYYFALKAIDEMANLSPLSNTDAHATTTQGDDNTAPAKIDDLATDITTRSAVQLTWTAPGDDGDQGTATYYDVRYLEEEAVTEENWDEALQASNEPIPAVAGTQEEFFVDDLMANTTYSFAIKAYDDGGNSSPISNSVSGTTRRASGGGGGGGGGGGDDEPEPTTTTTTPPPTTTTTTTSPPATITTTTPATTTTTTTTQPPATTSTTTTPSPDNPAGSTEKAVFKTTNLQISKTSLAPGETVQISVDVANTGEVSGTCEVDLIVNEKTEADRSTVLAAGETRTINFSVTKNDSGTYKVSVNGLEGSFKVVGAVQWVLIAEIIGGVVVLGLVIFVIRRIIMVNSM